jgi:hypothetical protein
VLSQASSLCLLPWGLLAGNGCCVSCKHEGPQHAHVLCINEFPASCGVLCCAIAGFIIVSAAMRLLADKGYCVERGIRYFREQRPPGIYKHDYINDLFRCGCACLSPASSRSSAEVA